MGLTLRIAEDEAMRTLREGYTRRRKKVVASDILGRTKLV
jgi:hypothetical protein